MSGTKRKISSKTTGKVGAQTGSSSFSGLSKELLIKMLDLMIKSRVLEERLIKIYKAGEAYFWIGAPGEEAWGVPLGLLVNKGRGPEYDYLHLHYRCTPTLIAMGMPMIDSVRIMMNRITDTSSGGKNFSNHYCYPEWNVVPVSSPIEVQYSMAIGTAWAQHRNKVLKTGKTSGPVPGISIITGGDAGSAEGDFASGLIWSTRKGNELPMLITVQNNKWGISTDYDSQHGEAHVSDRGKAFGMRTTVINGNDPVETYIRLQEEMAYIRKTGKPVLLEAKTSRLYGHSSASGANIIKSEECCIETFKEKLLKAGYIKESEIKKLYDTYEAEGVSAQEQARAEPVPQKENIWDHIFVNSENADWRKF
jgi:2-oxoisovalerate dehydrogenase E1 component alpha subunit